MLEHDTATATLTEYISFVTDFYEYSDPIGCRFEAAHNLLELTDKPLPVFLLLHYNLIINSSRGNEAETFTAYT